MNLGPRHQLVLDERWLIPATRDRVFEALTTPDLLARWWGPVGFTVPEIDLDLAPGGRYRFGMQPPEGPMFHLDGEFVTLEPPRLLAYTFAWDPPDPDDQETVVRLTLEESGGATTLDLSQGEFLTEARLELHRAGWSDSVAKLTALLGDRRS